MNDNVFASIGKGIIGVLGIFITIPLWGWVISWVWLWLVAPVWGLQPLSVGQCIGLSFFVGLFVKTCKQETDTDDTFWTLLAKGILTEFITLGLAWILHQFI